MSRSFNGRLLLAALGLGALLASGAARADKVYWSVGIDAPHSGVSTHVSNMPPPRVVHAPPMMVYGAPVVHAPRYYAQPVVVVRDRRGHHHHHHHHVHHRKWQGHGHHHGHHHGHRHHRGWSSGHHGHHDHD